MTISTDDERARFRALHQHRCFVLPNPWDVGSARVFNMSDSRHSLRPAAATLGRPDYAVTRKDVLAHLSELSSAVDLPINADFESGHARDPEGVAQSVRLAIATGTAGLSIEDTDLEHARLYERPIAVERVRAARRAIDQSGHDVLLVARTERLLSEPDALTPAIDTLVAFADAGADCLYAPGVKGAEAIATMVRAVAPKPLNVSVLDPTMSLASFADLGVRRVSVGGALSAVGWAATVSAAKLIKDGTFSALHERMPGRELNQIFSAFK